MSNRRPAKLLPVKFNLRSALPPDPNGRVYQYNAQLTMANPQRHSSVVHGNKQYTLEDLLVGDYVSTTGNGRIMKIVTITMELVIPDDDDNFRNDSYEAICDYLNDKLYTDPEYFGDFGEENITGVITAVE